MNLQSFPMIKKIVISLFLQTWQKREQAKQAKHCKDCEIISMTTFHYSKSLQVANCANQVAMIFNNKKLSLIILHSLQCFVFAMFMRSKLRFKIRPKMNLKLRSELWCSLPTIISNLCNVLLLSVFAMFIRPKMRFKMNLK